MQLSIIERKEKILQMLMDDNSVSVTNISKKLGVTVVTARSDLATLESEGFLVRTHGGAVPSRHPKLMRRMETNRETKSAIAQKAASLINDGETVIVTAGTTTALIAKYLIGKKDVHIVTNNTLLLSYARINMQVRITLIGGEFRPSEEGMIGPMAMSSLDQFHVSKAFIGIDGASQKQGFTAHFLESAELVRKMAQQADEVIVLSESEKFNSPGFARIIPYVDADVLITDSHLKDSEDAALKKALVRVLKVKL